MERAKILKNILLCIASRKKVMRVWGWVNKDRVNFPFNPIVGMYGPLLTLRSKGIWTVLFGGGGVIASGDCVWQLFN